VFTHSFFRPSALRAARNRKRHLTVDALEGRQLMSLGAEFLVSTPTPAAQFHPVNLNVATFDTVGKVGSGTTSEGPAYLRYKFGTTF
jgi:hypothetical protein